MDPSWIGFKMYERLHFGQTLRLRRDEEAKPPIHQLLHDHALRHAEGNRNVNGGELDVKRGVCRIPPPSPLPDEWFSGNRPSHQLRRVLKP